MKYAMVWVLAGYVFIVAQFGWWGLFAAALHIGSLVLFSRWK